MSIQNSPVVAVGPILPFGTFENGKLFLKMDGINNGLYVHFDGVWMMIGKIITTEPMRFEVPLANVPMTTNIPEQKLTITYGGNF